MTRTIVQATAACKLLLCAVIAAEADTTRPASEDDKIDDQIIVTGARTPLEISRIGSASTVITRQDIEQRQARYVSDLLRSVPGFAVSHTGVVGSQTQVRVRGSEANHVLVLIDGVRANDPAIGDEFRWEHLTTGDVERIEIVRGPQSALWGSDAVAAVVHVITRSQVDRGNFGAYVESGSNDTLNTGVNGAVNTGNWLLSGSIESLDTDGENIARAGTETDGAELTTGSASARWSAGENLSFGAGLRAVDASSQFDPVDGVVTGLPIDGDRETHSEDLAANLGMSLASGEGRFTYHLRAQYFESEQRNLTDGAENSSAASDRITLMLQSDILLGDNRLSLALEHENTGYEQRGEVVFADPNQDQDLQRTSAIAEYQHLSGDRLTWILSGRLDEHSDFDNAITGKLSLAYRWSDMTRLRANIGTGHKTPTFAERFGFFPDLFIGNPDLEPETSVSLDVGLDQLFFDGVLAVEVSIYAQELRNEINGFVPVPDTFLATAENRDGVSERTGVELGAEWRLTPLLSAAASYTYTDADEEDELGRNVIELRRPRHAGSLVINYGSSNDRFRATLAADYGGTREDLFFPPFPAERQRVTLDSYWVVDLTAQYQLTPAIAVFARGSNLLDEEYEQVFGYRTLGRTAYVGLRATFGR